MSEKTKDYNAQPLPDDGSRLRGGTQGGEPSRAMNPKLAEEGTQATGAPSGADHVEPPARSLPRTDRK